MKSLCLNLPSIQKEFARLFDGSLDSVLSFEKLHLILNPTYTGHYFYVSGTTDENTVTTKSTDGSFAYWGNQSDEEMKNSYELAKELKEFIMSFNPSKLEDLVNGEHEEIRKFGKISNVRNRAAFIIGGKIITVPGLQLS